MKKTSLVAALLVCIFFSCPKENQTDEAGGEDWLDGSGDYNTNPKREIIDDFMKNGPDFPIGDNLQEIVEHLGEPIKKTVIEKQNIHNPEKTDLIEELYYEGLFLRIYHVTDMNRDIVVTIEVTGDEYDIQHRLVIGSKKEQVLAVLGEPDEEKSNILRYLAGEYVFGAVEFSFRDDILVSITWHYFID